MVPMKQIQKIHILEGIVRIVLAVASEKIIFFLFIKAIHMDDTSFLNL